MTLSGSSDNPREIRYMTIAPEVPEMLARFRPASPLRVTCPRCGAPPDESCFMRIGWSEGVEYFDPSRHVGAHAERRRVAKLRMEAE